MEYAGAAGRSGGAASDSGESYPSMHGQLWDESPEPVELKKEAEEAQTVLQDAKDSIVIQLGSDVVIPDHLAKTITGAEERLIESNTFIETQLLIKEEEEANIRQLRAAEVTALLEKNRALELQIQTNNAAIEACNVKYVNGFAACQKKWGANQELENAYQANVEICHKTGRDIWSFISAEQKKISPETPHSIGSTDDEGGAGMDTRGLKGVCPQCSQQVYDYDKRGIKDGKYYHHECMLLLGMTPSLDGNGCHKRAVNGDDEGAARRPKSQK